jgi:putative secretion ATPase (PEP-CTERM system associated)
MYLDYYKLTAMPFQLTPDRRFFFASREHSRAVSHLVYGLSQEEGFVVITGEIGAGKTMLVEYMWSQIDTSKFVPVRILTTQISGSDLLRLVAGGFGLTMTGSGKAKLLQRLEQYFAEKEAEGKRCLLVIDEAQNLPSSSLEELRMLSNISVNGRPPFQCLLLGQPQFRKMLGTPDLEQLRQRVLAAYHLGPLNDEDTRSYVLHRLKTAGWSGSPSFEEAAFLAIHRYANGIPRKINTLCSRVMLSGFLEGTSHITEHTVTSVADELAEDLGPRSQLGTTRRPGQIVTVDASDQDVPARLQAVETELTRITKLMKRALELAACFLEARP